MGCVIVDEHLYALIVLLPFIAGPFAFLTFYDLTVVYFFNLFALVKFTEVFYTFAAFANRIVVSNLAAFFICVVSFFSVFFLSVCFSAVTDFLVVGRVFEVTGVSGIAVVYKLVD